MESKAPKCTIALFSNRQEVEAVLTHLQNSGFPLRRASVLVNAWLKDDQWELDRVEDALISWGIPKAQTKRYQNHILQGNYLIALKSTDDELDRIQAILQQQGVQNWEMYDALFRLENH